ncbi:MAG: ABC transporter permease [Acidimicrobiia bacterium]|nr:ABC transporter permease [Acidimicrobiia bacterium]
MRNALRELRRRPRRFFAITAALTLLTVLLLFLGGLLDGLYLGGTGALRAQRADVVVYSADANDSIIRSRIGPELRRAVESVPGVVGVGGLGVSLLGAVVPGESDLADAAVIGYQRAPIGVPAVPPAGEAWADRRLEAFGVRQGMTLKLGPQQAPIKVRGWVEDTNYLLQGALWVAPATWRDVQNASRPDAQFLPGTFEILVAEGPGDAAGLARRIDAATDGATKTLTKDEAVLASPGTRQQKSTFNGIIFVTFAVVGLVVALFFALLTLERAPIYGVLKALGTTTRRLFAGVLVQGFALVAIAFAVGGLVTLGIVNLLPARIPLQLVGSRAITTFVGLMITGAIGSALSLRRIARIDPVTAIGTGT